MVPEPVFRFTGPEKIGILAGCFYVWDCWHIKK